MNDRRSYRIDKIASSIQVELRRLKAQVDLFWPKELKHLVEFGLKNGMIIVEFGSGPGYMTKRLMEEFPDSHVTGVEIDLFLTGVAKRHLEEKRFKNFHIIQTAIMPAGVASNTFDFAIARLLLEHLPDPLGAIREVYRVLKPGGKAVFIDNDFGMHLKTYPNIRELRDLYDAYCQSRYSEGGNPKIGRELPSLLKRADFVNLDFEIISAHSTILGGKAFLESEGVGIPTKLVQDGFLDGKTLGKISVQWRNMIQSENYSILRHLYLAYGEKIAK